MVQTRLNRIETRLNSKTRVHDQFTEINAGFYGHCLGVELYDRGPSDTHQLLRIVVEDDESWFLFKESFSVYWMEELQLLLSLANEWLDKNCKKTGWENRRIDNSNNTRDNTTPV